MQRFGPAIGITLALCLAGCGAPVGSNAAAVDNAVAPAGKATAQAAGGPCPFETRNARAATGPSMAPEGGEQATITVEVRNDSEGRVPTLSQRLTPPPEIVLDIDRDPMSTPQSDRGWSEIGIGGYPATPDYTHAVIRCLGTQVARVPVQRPQ